MLDSFDRTSPSLAGPSPLAGRVVSVAFAVIGLGFLCWALFGGSSAKAQQKDVRPATPNAANPAVPAPSAGERSGTSALAAHHVGSTSAMPAEPSREANLPAIPASPAPRDVARPQATRGAESVVRWRGPLAEGLLLLERGQAAAAHAWTQSRLESATQSDPSRVAIRILQARALLALGRTEPARAVFSECAGRTAPSCELLDAQFGLLACSAKGSLREIPAERLKLLAERGAAEPASWGGAMASLLLAQAGLRESQGRAERMEAARAQLQQALYSQALELKFETACQEQLAELTAQLVLAPRVSCTQPKMVMHTVEPGDSLTLLGRKYDSAMGTIRIVNGLRMDQGLVAGEKLKILPGPVCFRVDRWRLTGTLEIGGVFIRRYPVGIGAEGKTPSGSFSIQNKQANPDWYSNGRRIPFGDPRNILGTRWMGYDRQENGGLGAGLGLHGTALPESVPGRESAGCVRMLNKDVEELYEFLPRGAKVIVN